MLDKLTAWLSPGQRKALYGILATVGTLAVILGWANQVTVDAWVTLLISVAGLAGTVLAFVKAKSVDWKVLYAAGGAVLVAAKAIGWIDDQLETTVNQVIGALAVAVPMIVAFIRTDPSVATGQPAQELAADVAQQQIASPPLPAPDPPAVAPDAYEQDALPEEPRDERGEVNIVTIAAVLVIIVCVVLLVRWLV